MNKLLSTLILLLSISAPFKAESDSLPGRVQSKPVVIKLPSPSAVDSRPSIVKVEADKEADSNEVTIPVTKPKASSQPVTTASVPVGAAPSSFRQEVGGSPGVAQAPNINSLNSFLNPVVASGSPFGLQQASLSNGLNPQVPGLLSPQFGGSPSGPIPLAGQSNNGILGVLNALGKQISGAVGLNGILPQSSPQFGQASPNFPQIKRIPGAVGPPIAGLPNIPGLPIFPGLGGGSPNGQIDFLNLFSAISRRAFNGSSLSDLLPPNQAQKFADNITDTLLPNTADIDLSKFMGRWFEGINSPRATDQRCVVHHYGGLTENGKTATFTALKIYREGSEFGQVRYSIGYAFKGGRQDGMLQMHTSEASDPAPYWIYRVGPIGKDPFGNLQYEYAVVSNWIRYPVMVLVRDPDQFRQKYEEDVLRWLEDNQFINGFVRAFNLVQPSDYANCQYADSTFEIFG